MSNPNVNRNEYKLLFSIVSTSGYDDDNLGDKVKKVIKKDVVLGGFHFRMKNEKIEKERL